jgi:hypothetical protein
LTSFVYFNQQTSKTFVINLHQTKKGVSPFFRMNPKKILLALVVSMILLWNFFSIQKRGATIRIDFETTSKEGRSIENWYGVMERMQRVFVQCSLVSSSIEQTSSESSFSVVVDASCVDDFFCALSRHLNQLSRNERDWILFRVKINTIGDWSLKDCLATNGTVGCRSNPFVFTLWNEPRLPTTFLRHTLPFVGKNLVHFPDEVFPKDFSNRCYDRRDYSLLTDIGILQCILRRTELGGLLSQIGANKNGALAPSPFLQEANRLVQRAKEPSASFRKDLDEFLVQKGGELSSLLSHLIVDPLERKVLSSIHFLLVDINNPDQFLHDDNLNAFRRLCWTT